MGDTAVTFPGSESSVSPGELLAGRYRIKRRLGQGGMGTVFLAHHEALDQEVAIKVLAPELVSDPEFVFRLTREARAVAKLRSEHVVRVFDVDTADLASPYMVMEYLHGQSLGEEFARRGPLPVAEVLRYVLEALDAIAEAHSMGIVHRDLKPSNIFLASQPDRTCSVKVLDFGISKTDFQTEPTLDLTLSGTLLGTPLYMSPEQLRSSKDVDARADVWSMGIVMYQLLTGTTPFQGSTVGGMCFSIAETTPKPIRAFRKDVPATLERAVLRCLQRDPSHRFADGNALIQELNRFGPSSGASRWTNGRRMSVLAASAVACVLLGWWLWSSPTAPPVPDLSPSARESEPRQPEVAVEAVLEKSEPAAPAASAVPSPARSNAPPSAVPPRRSRVAPAVRDSGERAGSRLAPLSDYQRLWRMSPAVEWVKSGDTLTWFVEGGKANSK